VLPGGVPVWWLVACCCCAVCITYPTIHTVTLLCKLVRIYVHTVRINHRPLPCSSLRETRHCQLPCKRTSLLCRQQRDPGGDAHHNNANIPRVCLNRYNLIQVHVRVLRSNSV